MKDDDENQIGFIAQEMESVIPELVSGDLGKKGLIMVLTDINKSNTRT